MTKTDVNLEKLDEGRSTRRHAALWDQRYFELAEFQKKHGNCKVPYRYRENKTLATWVGTQRMSQTKMSKERKDRLDALGFDWDPHQTFWDQRYADLVEFKAEHGDCNVPQTHQKNTKLTVWVQNQRKAKNEMSEDKREKLNAIGFIWSQHEDSWNERYQELVQFKLKNNHCKVPYDYAETRQLGNWVNAQKVLKNKLSKEKRNKLDAIGFHWDLLEELWEERYQELVMFQSQHKHCRVTHRNTQNQQLLNWIHKLRFTKDKVSEERRNKLDAIGFEWDPLDTKWNEKYEELVKYKQVYGNCRVVQQYSECSKLAYWVSTQRKSRKMLSEEKIEKLNQLGFDWDALEAAWEEKYQELKNFKAENGHCKPSFACPETKKLGRWAYNQKINKEKLSEERLKKLNDIDFFEDRVKPIKNKRKKTPKNH